MLTHPTQLGVVAYAYKYLEGIARLGPFAGDIMHHKMRELHLLHQQHLFELSITVHVDTHPTQFIHNNIPSSNASLTLDESADRYRLV